MFPISEWTLREKVLAGAVACLCILLIAVWGFKEANGQHEEAPPPYQPFEIEKKETNPPKKEASPSTVVIEVKGAVERPGVYRLTQGARVYEALAKAGGPQSIADLNWVNQAMLLSDGMVIYVPRKGENMEQLPSFVNHISSSGPASSAAPAKKEGKIHINTATVEELEQLNGIGQAKANAIWSYRQEHGPFRSLEDIAQVPGIGEKTVQKFKDQVVFD